MKVAVVLFNLGGPDGIDAVKPFLFNLFYDPAIIRLPKLLRWLVARLISSRRAPVAREIYAKLGGGSPIVPNTERQASALEAQLGSGFKTFLAMRYWHPRAAAAIKRIAAWQPDTIVLLPLYPQYSTTTTASSLIEWRRLALHTLPAAKTVAICCFPLDPGFVAAVAERVRSGLARFPATGPRPRVLFSAHGLPKSVVEDGDPYQWQVSETVKAVVATLAIPDLDWQVCYQSRVGPLKWLEPATETEIRRAGKDKTPLLLVPIAFVSEHSETLVELDIEYAHLAQHEGVPSYVRVPTVDALPTFIDGLAKLVRDAAAGSAALCSGAGRRICPSSARRCPLAEI